MAGTIDDKRAASSITASLSSYLMTAALGVIAAEAIIVTFVFDKREQLFWFDSFSALGLIASTASIFFGGKGIFELTKKGYDGDWITKTSGGHFNKQALLALAGIVLVAVSVFCGKPKPDKPVPSQDYQSLRDNILRLERRIDSVESTDRAVSTRLDSVEANERKRAKAATRQKK